MNKKTKAKFRYEKPAIIYRDEIKTRAGSPLSQPDREKQDPFDPANLFGKD